MRNDLAGKVALVCGSTRGIGRTVAETFASAGADVVVHGRNPKAGEEAARTIEGYGRRALFLTADLSDFGQVREMVEKVLGTWGRIDILKYCLLLSMVISGATSQRCVPDPRGARVGAEATAVRSAVGIVWMDTSVGSTSVGAGVGARVGVGAHATSATENNITTNKI